MKKITLLFILLSILFVSCIDNTQVKYNTEGKPHIIKLYGYDSKIINQWESIGIVSLETHSNCFYFQDAKTGKPIEVTGTVTIELK